MLETVVFCLSIVLMFTVVSVIKANHKLKSLMAKEETRKALFEKAENDLTKDPNGQNLKYRRVF